MRGEAKYYTGVGSRKTPDDVLDVLEKLSLKLCAEGWVLRSGGAEGADTSFEKGALSFSKNLRAEIFLPWRGFNRRELGINSAVIIPDGEEICEKAKKIVSEIHPAWDKCSPTVKVLHSRNVFQVLGKDLKTPSKFLVCWAPVDKQGVPKGGTRTTWVLAEQNNIPCFNLIFEDHRNRIKDYIDK